MQHCHTAVAPSSGEAELVGAAKAASDGLGFQSSAFDLGWGLAAKAHTDSSVAQGICSRSDAGKARHLTVGQLPGQDRSR